jgi:hypothetical protein
MSAATLTTGDGWSESEFCKSNVTAHDLSAAGPPDAALNTICPTL